MNGDEAAAENVQVYTTSRHLRSPPFSLPEEPIEAGRAWEEWLEGIEREFRYFRITDPNDKKDALIIYGGRDLARLERSLPDGEVGENDAYFILKRKLNEHFLPKKNKHHGRYIFLKMRPTPSEPTIAYAARLREQAKQCEFGDSSDDRILEHLIQTIDNQQLIQKTINKKWNLEQFLTEASQVEDISMQMKQMKDKTVAKVQGHAGKAKSFKGKGKSQPIDHKQCDYCGLTGAHGKGQNCPAFGKICNKCHRRNHFAVVCRSKSSSSAAEDKQQRQGKGTKSRHTKSHVKKTTEDQESTSSDDDFFDSTVKHLHVKRLATHQSVEKTIPVLIDDVKTWVEPDSGADINLMDKHQFKSFQHRTQTSPVLQPCDIKLRNLQTRLPVRGCFETTIRNATCGIRTQFVIMDGKMNSPPLLSRDTLTQLGMMKIKEDGSFAAPNDLRIRAVVKDIAKPQSRMKEIIQRHPEVFEGIGLIHDKKNNKEFYAKFQMKPEAVPVAQKPRQVPYHLKEPLKKWLDQGLAEGIFEWVPDGEAVTWCSPLVVQPKPKFAHVAKDKLEPQMIRASVDLRVPNKSMERTRVIQAPVVEDFVHKFHDCKIFTKLDMRQGYHQLLLDPASRQVATFSTPWGNMRPKRLVFGAKASQDIFDEAVYKIFGDIPRCLNQRDDILIGGRSQEEHDSTLADVLQRAADFGVTFNLEKADFGQSSIDFYGYKFTDEGLKPAPEKVTAIKECQAPESKSAVRSFLGMVGYLSKFIPRYSSLTAPLRKLTHKDTQFRWSSEEEKAFRCLKDCISSEDTMAYFDPSKAIVLRTEASFNEGLAAGLFQTTDKGLQPVHFISRTLTDTERRYSQTEKDALAIKWAKDRFRTYLLGAPRFTIVTAHKPLLQLFNKSTAKLPPRIEKWVMDMQDVDFELTYQPGKDEADPLDYLSRHPLPVRGNDDTEKMIKNTVLAEHAIVLDRICEDTSKDAELQKLKTVIREGTWDQHRKDPDIHPFYSIRQELYVAEELIFKDKQIILPTSLRRKVVKTAHRMGHLGITKTKEMLRARYWFPGLNSMVEQIVGQCLHCQITTKAHQQEPVKMTDIPQQPWEVVSVDFGGPYPDGHYNLVVIDKRTRYPEVERVKSTACQPTIDKLRGIFATHGIPRMLCSDNGPPFQSHEFQQFAVEEGFKHHKVTPLHPRSNGEAESFMKVLNKTEQIIHLQKQTEHERKRSFQDMLTAYRSTPHPATGVAPYEALMRRPVRNKLDYIDGKRVMSNLDQRINEHDQIYKQKLMRQSKNQNTKCHNFVIGDYVLVRQTKRTKWSTAYEPQFYVIYRIDGSSIGARRISDNRQVYRDSSHFKLANSLVERAPLLETGDESDWREKVLAETLEDSKPSGNNHSGDSLTNTSSLVDDGPNNTIDTDAISLDDVGAKDTSTTIVSRPRRNRKQPAYLREYVL